MGAIDKTEFERIVNNLLAQKPMKREDAKTGRAKESGKIIPDPKTHPLVQK